jgi:hypothetical protein
VRTFEEMDIDHTLNYYGSDDWQIKEFTKICRLFCEFKIDKKNQKITYILDTPEKEEKFQHAFENFNWND